MTLFASCCCSDQEEKTQIDFASVPEETLTTTGAATEDCPVLLGSAGINSEAKGSRRHEQHDTTAGKAPALLKQACSDDAVPGSPPVPYPDDQADSAQSHPKPGTWPPISEVLDTKVESEHLRLFMKQAAKGCPCTILSGRNFKRSSAEYFVDESTRELAVYLTRVQDPPELRCPISQILDIYTVEEDGKECFQEELLRTLDSEELDRLLMIVASEGRKKKRTLHMLDTSRQSKEAFLEVLRLLSIDTQEARAV